MIKNLTCGGLNIGGGGSQIAEGPTPSGSVSRFNLSCAGAACTVSANTTVPGVSTAAPDCTNTGCNFGTPLPIPNPAIPSISTCVVNKWGTPATGTLNLTSGAASLSIPLASDVYLTGVALCPKCSATGSPGSPGVGTCMGGLRNGLACTSTNPTGLTRDCIPTNATKIGTISVNLSPSETNTRTSTNATGQFCPGQTVTAAGCFGSNALPDDQRERRAGGRAHDRHPEDRDPGVDLLHPRNGQRRRGRIGEPAGAGGGLAARNVHRQLNESDRCPPEPGARAPGDRLPEPTRSDPPAGGTLRGSRSTTRAAQVTRQPSETATTSVMPQTHTRAKAPIPAP